jgi:hypothetical protein
LTVDRTPFEDVLFDGDAFSIPELKWRELLFVGALKPDGLGFVRDPERPLPPFRRGELFPCGRRFRASRAAGRVRIERL